MIITCGRWNEYPFPEVRADVKRDFSGNSRLAWAKVKLSANRRQSSYRYDSFVFNDKSWYETEFIRHPSPDYSKISLFIHLVAAFKLEERHRVHDSLQEDSHRHAAHRHSKATAADDGR